MVKFDPDANLPEALQRRLDQWDKDPPNWQFKAYGPLMHTCRATNSCQATIWLNEVCPKPFCSEVLRYQSSVLPSIPASHVCLIKRQCPQQQEDAQWWWGISGRRYWQREEECQEKKNFAEENIFSLCCLRQRCILWCTGASHLSGYK